MSGNQGKNATQRNATPRQFTLIFALRPRPPLRSLARSLAHFAHSLARGTVNDQMAILSVFFSISDHNALSRTCHFPLPVPPHPRRLYGEDASGVVRAEPVSGVPYPVWALVLAGILILIALLWIPGVAIGCIKMKQEEPTHFPEDDLRLERRIQVGI